jgi:hypothetical protein
VSAKRSSKGRPSVPARGRTGSSGNEADNIFIETVEALEARGFPLDNRDDRRLLRTAVLTYLNGARMSEHHAQRAEGLIDFAEEILREAKASEAEDHKTERLADIEDREERRKVDLNERLTDLKIRKTQAENDERRRDELHTEELLQKRVDRRLGSREREVFIWLNASATVIALCIACVSIVLLILTSHPSDPKTYAPPGIGLALTAVIARLAGVKNIHDVISIVQTGMPRPEEKALQPREPSPQ